MVDVFSPCHAAPIGQARENWPQLSNIVLEKIKRFFDDQSARYKNGGVSGQCEPKHKILALA
jgi:hypothetical protein